ncbi:hypothetical protein FACS189443_1390 [Planctomycetales bacterium]|nr:hypothetical protein FACS189443_1390 [Planctomycetales bacterium]
MKTFTKLTLAALIVFGTAFTAKAEWLVSQRDSIPNFAYQLMTKEGQSSAWADGVEVYDKDADIAYRVFCTDFYTKTSGGFSSEGQQYNPVALDLSPFHSDTQKTQLQSLFDHVYTKAFNADYSYNNEFYASLFNLAVWEIVHETRNALSLANGDFYITNAIAISQGPNGENWNSWSKDALDKARSVTADWFDAILNDTWDDYGYSEDKVNLTVYMAEGGTDVSQTFIGVAPNITPEPATMLIIGLGLAGLGLARRCRKNK